jgi:Bacterial membrane protein YfhO
VKASRTRRPPTHKQFLRPHLPVNLPWEPSRRTIVLLGVVFLLVCVLVFFHEALTTGGIPAPLGILYASEPWSAEIPHLQYGQNSLLSDVPYQMYPWHFLVWNEWRHGRIPLWNPYSLHGTPLLGNDQSAPFYPLTLLTLPLSFAHAWLLLSMSKIFLAGLGMYVFLLRLRLHILAALFGAVAFMLSGFLVDWLGMANGTVASFLPWLFWCVELSLDAEFPAFLSLVAVAFVVGIQFLAGHIETSALLLPATALYACVRITTFPERTVRRALRALGICAVGLIWGSALAAVQLLPAVDAIFHSANYAIRAHLAAGHTPSALSPPYLLTWLVPNLFGNQSIGTHAYYGSFNYNEQVGYVGIVTLLVSLWSWKGAQAIGLYSAYGALVAVLLLFTCVAYNVPGVVLLASIAPLKYAGTSRLTVIVCFTVASLGAFGIQGLLTGNYNQLTWVKRWGVQWRAYSIPVVGAFVCGFLAIFFRLAQSMPGSPPGRLVMSAFHGLRIGLNSDWLSVALTSSVVAATFGALTCMLIAIGTLGRPTMTRVAWVACALVLLNFSDLFLWGNAYNPVVAGSPVEPTPLIVRKLQQLAGNNGIVASPGILPSNTSIFYRLHDLRAYEPTASDRAAFYTSPGQGMFFSFRPQAKWLSLANITFDVTDGSPPSAQIEGAELNSGSVGEIRGLITVQQDFVPARDDLEALSVYMTTPGRRLSAYPVRFSLADTTTGRMLHHWSVRANTIVGRFLFLYLPPVRHIAGHTLSLRISAPKAGPGDAPSIWLQQGKPLIGTRLTVQGSPVPGALFFNTYFRTADAAHFRPVWNNADVAIWRNTWARPRTYFASRLLKAGSAAAAFSVLDGLRGGRRDRTTVVEGAPASLPRLSTSGRVKTIVDVPGHVGMQTDATGPVFLVLTESSDPGWHATVDGRRVSVYHANYLFQGVFVPAGRHHVDFTYLPDSFLLGSFSSGIALLIGLLGCVAWWVRAWLTARARP